MGRKTVRLAIVLFLALMSAVYPADAAGERRLIPGGKLVGVAVNADGLIYIGASDLGADASPARLAGLKSGDIIRRINGEEFKGIGGFSSLIRAGKQNRLEVDRNGETLSFILTPGTDPRDGKTKIGAWVRENVAGVGTLTFIDPETGLYAALGHAISDPDAGVNVPVGEGTLFESDLTGVIKGRKGVPGELKGEFAEKNMPLGTITQNVSSGIMGTYVKGDLSGFMYPEGLWTADKSEIREGKAQILSTVDSEGIKAYDIEILKTDFSGSERNMLFRVTDEQLLDITGGIVQGMSGSPIIQDGKLVGAVTHVLVNDPTRGYGIFIENMPEAAG